MQAIDLVFRNLPTALRMSDIRGQNTPFDLLWEGRRLCIRAARMSPESKAPKWNYSLEAKKSEVVDYFILFTIKNEEVYKIFVVPSVIAPATTVAITEHGDFIRYGMFEATLENIGNKIKEIEREIPKLKKLHDETEIK